MGMHLLDRMTGKPYLPDYGRFADHPPGIVAFANKTVLAVATKVKSGRITSSPAVMPRPVMVTSKTAVPFVTAIPWLAP